MDELCEDEVYANRVDVSVFDLCVWFVDWAGLRSQYDSACLVGCQSVDWRPAIDRKLVEKFLVKLVQYRNLWVG